MKHFFLLIALVPVVLWAQPADSSKIIITDKNDAVEIKIGDSVLSISHDYMASRYLQSGLQQAIKGDYEGAIADFNAALLFNFTDPEIYYNRGLAYNYLRKYEDALTDFSKTVSLDSMYAEAYCQRGVIKCRLYSCDGALEDFDRALGIKPDYVLCYFNKGVAYLQLGEFDLGCPLLEKSLEMGYENAEDILTQYCR